MPGTDRRRSTRSADGGDGHRELAVLGTGLAVVDASADGGDGRHELAVLGAGLAVVNATLRRSIGEPVRLRFSPSAILS